MVTNDRIKGYWQSGTTKKINFYGQLAQPPLESFFNSSVEYTFTT
jgi:hypothetical protein